MLRHCANLAAVTATRTMLSTAQVAELIGRSIKTVQRMAASGELPAEKLPGRTGAFIFDSMQVELWQLRQQREAT